MMTAIASVTPCGSGCTIGPIASMDEAGLAAGVCCFQSLSALTETNLSEYRNRHEEQLGQDLVRFSRWLSRLGFTPGTSGNLSVRLDEKRLLATPTGVSKGMVKSADLVIIDLKGGLLNGTRNVTSEIGMHLAIYERRRDVAAVVHAHPAIATAFACSGRPLDQVLCQESVMTIGAIPLAQYATTGTEEVAASLRPYIAAHDAILLANHGAVSYGSTLADAFMKMETIEHIAHVALVAHQLGSARPLLMEQVEALHRAKAKYQDNAAAQSGAAIDFAS
jgi:L-fuculose-phosphate aldolase